jgi:hypothetical protein
MSTHDERDGHVDERLADWVDGRMAPGERADFEAWLAQDAARQADADAYRSTVEAVRGALHHGPLAPRDFADRVLEAANRRDPTPQDSARARRFAWKASAAAAAIFALLFFLLERLDRAPQRAEDLALSAESERIGQVDLRNEDGVLGLEGFVDPFVDARGEPAQGSRSVSVLLEPNGLEIGSLLPQEETEWLGFGGERPIRAPTLGGGGGGLTGGMRARVGPSTPGPATAPPGAPAPKRRAPDVGSAGSPDGPVQRGATDLFFGVGALQEQGPVGALVYVISWPSAPADDAQPEGSGEPVQESSGGRATPEAPVRSGVSPVDPVLWFRAQVQQLPQDNVIVLPLDVVPLDLEPARLALGAVAGEEATRNPGEFWPEAGDRAFRMLGDAAQRERLLRGLFLTAREQGATLAVRRSRFRRLDLRPEDDDSAADLALVLRGPIPPAPPAPPAQREQRR